MPADRKLIVEIVGDDASLQNALQRSTQNIDKFGKTVARKSTVSSASGPLGQFQRETQAILQESKRVDVELEKIERRQVERRDRIAKAATIGGGFFALGRGVQGAGAALEVFSGHATASSQALNDAGDAIQSLITLNPAGFFKAVGASAERQRQQLDQFAQGIKDVNREQEILNIAQVAAATGNERQAQAIRDTLDELKAMKAATEALDFAQRALNSTMIDGRAALVRFRGAADSLGIRGGLQGPGGVALERTLTKQPTVNVNVELDGRQVAKSVTLYQQKVRRSNPIQKRGGGASNSPDSR